MVDDLPLPLTPRLAAELRLLRTEGPLSRSDLHRRTAIRKNTVGADIASLLETGLLRQEDGPVSTQGRPSQPVALDLKRRCVVGLAIGPGPVACARVDLLGQAQGPVTSRQVADPAERVAVAAELLRIEAERTVGARPLAAGISVPGFIGDSGRSVLSSSAWPNQRGIDLSPLHAAWPFGPVVVENLTNATATGWLLAHLSDAAPQHLLVYLSDRMLGATFLVGGRPIPGCLTGSNELGHMRLPVATPLCYCGREGCLEQIASTAFLQQLDPHLPAMSRAVVEEARSPAVERMTSLLACGLANAIHFARPGRITLMTDLPTLGPWLERLMAATHQWLLDELRDRVQLDAWIDPVADPAAHAARAAAAPALALLYLPERLPEAVAP